MSAMITLGTLTIIALSLIILAIGVLVVSLKDGFRIGRLAGGVFSFFVAGALFAFAMSRIQPETDLFRLQARSFVLFVLFEAMGFFLSAGFRKLKNN